MSAIDRKPGATLLSRLGGTGHGAGHMPAGLMWGRAQCPSVQSRSLTWPGGLTPSSRLLIKLELDQ